MAPSLGETQLQTITFTQFNNFSLDNTGSPVYHPVVNVKKHSLAAGKSIMKYRYDRSKVTLPNLMFD